MEKASLVFNQDLFKPAVISWGQAILLKEESTNAIIEAFQTEFPVNQSNVKGEDSFVLLAHFWKDLIAHW